MALYDACGGVAPGHLRHLRACCALTGIDVAYAFTAVSLPERVMLLGDGDNWYTSSNVTKVTALIERGASVNFQGNARA
eukprot:837437-Rhodomonas_salina.2